VTEQFAVEEALGERGAVQLDERPIPARRQIGEAGREQLLAGAALADQQNRSVERGQQGQPRQRLAKDRRLPDWRRNLGRYMGENGYFLSKNLKYWRQPLSQRCHTIKVSR
jgi:hypothetical protein